MNKNKCLVCGSFNFRADRALSGRLICISCGSPYGVRKVGRKKSIAHNALSIINKKLFFIIIFMFVFILIVI